VPPTTTPAYHPALHWDGKLPPPEPAHGDIAIALSGGGNRAAIFALGVLLYLVDTGLNKRVALISSVSGGSITNGFVAQHCDFAQATPEAFDRVAADLLNRIVRHGLFHGSWVVWAYLAVLAVGAALVTTAYAYGWPAALPGWVAALLFVALGALALLRGSVISLQLAQRFFTHQGIPTKLNALSRSVEHIFCATDITSAAPFYFSTWDGGYVYSPALGYSRLKNTRLEHTTLTTAVRASAAFPGGIPPKRLALGDVRHEFRITTEAARWQTERTQYRQAGEYRPRRLFLADGGVWNNLGTQAITEHKLFHGLKHWGSGIDWRKPKWKLVVANASAPMRAAALWRLHVPILGEFASLTRSLNTLNSNTVEPRIAALRAGRESVIVSIDEVRDRAIGYSEASEYKRRYPDDPEIAKLPNDLDFWTWGELRIYESLMHESLAWHCSKIPTTLGRISRRDALLLLMHAYQNTLGEMIAAGYPRPRPSPRFERFARLIPARRGEAERPSVPEKIRKWW
jgi:predicted acylesterase/phospholipase RssA